MCLHNYVYVQPLSTCDMDSLSYLWMWEYQPNWDLFLLRLFVENSIAYLQDTKQNKQAKPDLAVQSILRVDCITIVHRKLHCGHP
jgi:hypothetical protein